MSKNFIFSVLFFSLAALQADIIYLRSGQTLSGKIVAVSPAAIVIETPNGRQTLAKGAVRRIVYGVTEDPDKKKKEEEQRKKLEEQRKKQEELQKELQKQREDELKRRQDELDRQKQEALSKPQRRPEPEISGSASMEGAIWRSALLPGWGQFYQGRSLEGSVYLASFLAVAGAAGYAGSQYSAHRSAYRSSASMLLYSSPLAADKIGVGLPYDNFALMYAIQNSNGINSAAQEKAGRDMTVALLMMNSLKNSRVESTAFIKEAFFLNLTSKTLAERKAMQKAAASTNVLASVALGLYAWNIADAALFHPTSSTFIGLYPTPDQAGLAFGLYF
jgi:hypothetical protein